MTEDEDYRADAPVPVGPLSAEVDEALAPPPPRGVPLQVAAVGALVLLVIGVGAGRWSAPVPVTRTAPGPTATVTATVTERAGSTSVAPVTVTGTSTVTEVPTATVTQNLTATRRILVPGAVRTVTRQGPALIVRITDTVTRTVRAGRK